MTDNCIKQIEELEKNDETFERLSVEQLLYSAIKGSGIEDVKYVLDNTNWDEMILKGKQL